MDIKIEKLEDLGWNRIQESQINKLDLDDSNIARVIAEYKELYKIKNLNGEFLAKVTGKKMFTAESRLDYPAVGDFVLITPSDKEHATINKILPRLTILKRKSGLDTQIIATNIDVAFIVESVNRDYNLNRFERYFTIAQNGGVKPVIVLNKIDLLQKEEIDEKLQELKNRFPDTDIILTSIINDNDLQNIRRYIEGNKTYCFLGSSGVGKSSLINKLIGNDSIKTKDVSTYSDRGKHTTTERQMYFLENGGIVIDNPGTREVGITDITDDVNHFNEITSQRCKFADCTHTHEPGCKVIDSLKEGKIDQEKYLNYLNLKKEAEFNDMSDLEKKEKDYKFGKFLKNAKKELKKYKE